MIRKLTAAMLLIVLYPYHLFAWGHAGHAMVAELAMSMLSDATRMKVKRMLGGMSAAEAGNWMDAVRSDPKYRYTARWHFTNIEPGGTYKPAPKGDIITALNKAYTALQHPEKLSAEQRKFDVLILFHLCGDLLQPLHVGYGSDKGGNTYQVNYNGKGTNLHHIWDSEIIKKEKIKLKNLQDAKSNLLPKGTKGLFDKVNFDQSLKSGRKALVRVYDVKGHKISDAYLKDNKSVVVAQLTRAGYLLARCLEQLMGKAGKYRPVSQHPQR